MRELGKKWGIRILYELFLVLVSLAVLLLYNVPWEPVIYILVLVFLAELLRCGNEYRKYRQKRKSLEIVLDNPEISLERLPLPESENEALYQEICRSLNKKRIDMENQQNLFFSEMSDYYTMWVHQVKTPIAAARLLLQEEEPDSSAVQNEIFKIEQYVEMVLGYLRTEGISSDIRIEEVKLDKVIRDQIHKFARIFVGKRLALEYEGTEEVVLTDEKWLGFVIGQLLSNALKYTDKGKISIYLSEQEGNTLVIQDTGIGIRSEDLPRVFEKGFTGYNGREESHSTGIGLYLCGKIMKKLNHQIRIESEPGKGTKVFLSLDRENIELY